MCFALLRASVCLLAVVGWLGAAEAQELRLTAVQWQTPPCVTSNYGQVCAPGTDTTVPPHTISQTNVYGYPPPFGSVTATDNLQSSIADPCNYSWYKLNVDVPVSQSQAPVHGTFSGEAYGSSFFCGSFASHSAARGRVRMLFDVLPGANSKGTQALVRVSADMSSFSSGSCTAQGIAYLSVGMLNGPVIKTQSFLSGPGSCSAKSGKFDTAGFAVQVGQTVAVEIDLSALSGQNLSSALASLTNGQIDLWPDTDGDGLFDHWELQKGIDVDFDGSTELSLVGIGGADPDPNVSDVYVEIDGMSGFKPAPNTLLPVELAFLSRGIVLHLQDGGDTIQTAPWNTPWTEYSVAKGASFGTPSERGAGTWATLGRAAKLSFFRYCIFAESSLVLGRGELPGNDFYVTLGGSDPQHPTGTPATQAAAFMHELGHTFGLGHGGDDHISHKPNYHSVMNYFWTFPTKANAQGYALDYSSDHFSVLDESFLQDNVVWGPPNHATHMTIYTTNVCSDPTGPAKTYIMPEIGPVDWNRNNVVDPNSAVNINFLGYNFAIGHGFCEPLTGHDDWQYVLKHLTPQQGSDVLTATYPEMTVAEYQELIALPAAPIRHCSPALNSTGLPGVLGFAGSSSVSGNEVSLTVAQLPAHVSAIMFYGPQAVQIPFGNGFLCVGGGSTGLFYFGPPTKTDANGALLRVIDMNIPPAGGGGPGTITPGSIWNFQCAYRDPAAASRFFSYTDALTITFDP